VVTDLKMYVLEQIYNLCTKTKFKFCPLRINNESMGMYM
jgi:hypothetical protein